MPARLRKAALPYLLLLPGLGWLLVFFVIPLAIMAILLGILPTVFFFAFTNNTVAVMFKLFS